MPDSQAISMAVRIIHDAGGELIGRIRLQKIAFLMAEMGFLRDIPEKLSFEYYHYGPYSEALAKDLDSCVENKRLDEETKETGWGNEYYVYKLPEQQAVIADGASDREKAFVKNIKEYSSVLLELAATALYLYQHEGFSKQGNAWAETKSRKQVKARDGRLKQAFALYEEMRHMPAPQPLPEIPFPS